MTKEEFKSKHNLTDREITTLMSLSPTTYHKFSSKITSEWLFKHNMTRQQLQDIAYCDYGPED